MIDWACFIPSQHSEISRCADELSICREKSHSWPVTAQFNCSQQMLFPAIFTRAVESWERKLVGELKTQY
jgi:hypothetical protein